MNKKCLAVGLLPVVLAGLGWLFRYDLSFGPYYTVYDITVTDTLTTFRRGLLQFGSHEFSVAGFEWNAVEVGVAAPIPDTAIQAYVGTVQLDPKYIHIDEEGMRHYQGPPVPDPPTHYVKIPVRSRLPVRMPWQKYHFHFTHYPNDSIHLKIQVLDKGNCAHIDRLAATAYLRPGPCSF